MKDIQNWYCITSYKKQITYQYKYIFYLLESLKGRELFNIHLIRNILRVDNDLSQHDVIWV